MNRGGTETINLVDVERPFSDTLVMDDASYVIINGEFVLFTNGKKVVVFADTRIPIFLEKNARMVKKKRSFEGGEFKPLPVTMSGANLLYMSARVID